jgi:hypothetical protein
MWKSDIKLNTDPQCITEWDNNPTFGIVSHSIKLGSNIKSKMWYETHNTRVRNPNSGSRHENTQANNQEEKYNIKNAINKTQVTTSNNKKQSEN